MALEPGTIFAKKYRIVRPLEEGGMGAVYEAEQIKVGRRVALKTMLPDFVASEEHRRRFEQEARASARIESDYVVKVYDHDIDDETRTPWIEMELLRGENLGTMMARRGALSPPEVLAIFEDVAKGLGPAHAAGVIHLDLKPENLFVVKMQDRTIVKVLDFGISKIAAEQRKSAKVTTLLASPMFLAPEQAKRNASVTAATDVWALGLIAFYLLTGRFYWVNANLAPGESFDQGAQLELLMEIGASTLDPPSTRARDVGSRATLPAGFDAWFARCVTRDAPRFANATEAVDALRTVLGALGPTSRVPEPGSLAPPPPPPPPPPQQRPPAPPAPEPRVAPPPAPAAPVATPPLASAAPVAAPIPATRPLAAPVIAPTVPLSPSVLPVATMPVQVISYPETPPTETTAPEAPRRSRLVLGAGVLAVALVAAAVLNASRTSAPSPSAPMPVPAPSPSSTNPAPVVPRPAAPAAQPTLPPLPESNAFIALPDGSLLVQEHEVTRGEFALWQQRAHPNLAAPVGTAEFPMVNVTRALAAEYCAAFSGARLPTRDEWRRALGADLAWTLTVAPARALAAGGSSTRDERSLSAGSLYDLVANVNEWTADGPDSAAYAMGAFYGEPRDTVADYLREGNIEAGPSEHTGLRCVR